MSGKKHVFKMVPGEKLSNNTFSYISWPDFDRLQSVKKVKLISLEKGDEVIELPIVFCTFSADFTDCVREEKNILTNQVIANKYVDFRTSSYAFVYYDDVLVKLSMKLPCVLTKDCIDQFLTVVKSEILEYNYLTLEESDTSDNKYYFSDDQGNIIDSPDNDSLQYLAQDAKKEVIEITKDILPKISENIILSKAFVEIFVEKLTESQLKTFANSLSNEQLQVLAQNLTDGQLQKIIPELNSNQLQALAENLTDNQFLALVDHLTNHQLQALTHTLDSKKLGIIVPLLNKDQVANLVKDFNLDQVKEIFPHLKMDQFQEVINTMSNDQFVELIKDADEKAFNTLLHQALKDRLPTLVKMLEGDRLHNLINKLDHDKLAIVARDLTDSNKIQIIIKSLADNPDKLQAFAHSMSNEQFKELLDNVDAEELKDIIHKLPHEKVMSVIGDLSSKDQSNAIIDALKEKLEEQNKHNEEIKEMLKQIKDDMPEIGQAPDFTIVDINNDSLLFV
ncbi:MULTISPECIES: MgtE intracellular N domain protein [Wolbachia]|uniref:MgtE intracellular N domain protein n=1 Tax=Wolbachia TaxID=953 RepID=UPI001E52890F|nr:MULTISPECIES: MgtE intracellular N domain protein [unclassified Wolbachia]UFO00984.1 MgtE intracellular N domain protein [Wolbachia endosymbiont of Corcyra cephalonica]